MRLLVITQTVDRKDPILGFFHRWLEEFAENTESLIVICLKEGEHNLPKNVKVLSLGKERDTGRFAYMVRFYFYIWRERKSYDAVFVHMNQIYVILGGLLWRLWRKKVFLWYTHKATNISLRLAIPFVNKILTASKESFRIRTKKVLVTGHGIDIKKFYPKDRDRVNGLKLLHIGRIDATKRIHTMLEVLSHLREEGLYATLTLVGSVPSKESSYGKRIYYYIEKHNLSGYVIFAGEVSNEDVVQFYHEHDIFLNFSDTGSMDKAVLEALATDTSVLTSNDAFSGILPVEYITSNDHEEIVSKIKSLINKQRSASLVEYVQKEHSLDKLIPRIISLYN